MTGSLFSSTIATSLTCRFIQDYLEDTLHTSISLPHLPDNIQLLSNMAFQEKPTKYIFSGIPHDCDRSFISIMKMELKSFAVVLFNIFMNISNYIINQEFYFIHQL
jgi:hypothetical protein